MGEVYLAEDERLGRRVALKCPSDAWFRSPDARERLHREARAAARLNDPRIAAVYDVLDVEERPYLVFEYVDGETLAQVLSRLPLPVDRALDLAIEIAEALVTAHRAGVIHRDLKPANVMLTPDGRIKILDFGIAKTVGGPGGSGTTIGQVLGTPGYIAPEQLLGRPADARSDIYAVGAILYELLTGRMAVPDAASGAIRSLLTPVPDIRSINPAVPEPVAHVVARALAAEPRERFQSAQELTNGLKRARAAVGELPTPEPAPLVHRARLQRWITAGVLLALLSAVGVPFARWWRDRLEPVVSARTPVVAVLPFEGDPKLQYMGAGIADTVSTKLSGVAGLSVISRAEIHDAFQRNKEVSKVCRALGATFVVNGFIQQAGDRVQVTVSLLTPDGKKIRDGKIYGDVSQNLFALQQRIAEDLTGAMVVNLTATDQAQLGRALTKDSEAMSAYWRGRDLLDRPGPDPISGAIEAFEDATSRDPSFALGYAALGSAYWRQYEQTRDKAWVAKATQAAEHARVLDPDLADARITLATVYAGSGRQVDAVDELNRALELQPNNDRAHRLLANIHASQGRTGQAVKEYQAAIRIRPEYWETYRGLGVLYMRAGRYEEAIRAFTEITAKQPDSPFGYQLLGTVHATMLDLDAATRDYETALKHGGSFGTYSALGTVYYLQGRFEDAADRYQQAIKLRPRNATTHWNLGDAYRRLGRKPEARRAYEEAARLSDEDLAVNPKAAMPLALRGVCRARLGHVADGLADVNHAAELAPQDQDVQYQRALVLMIAGRTDSAIDAVSQAIADGYSVKLLSRDDDLAPLRKSSRFQALLSGTRGAAPGRAK
jgi:serine/threonine-protein kinase